MGGDPIVVVLPTLVNVTHSIRREKVVSAGAWGQHEGCGVLRQMCLSLSAPPHHTRADTEVCAVGAERLARVLKGRLTWLDLPAPRYVRQRVIHWRPAAHGWHRSRESPAYPCVGQTVKQAWQ